MNKKYTIVAIIFTIIATTLWGQSYKSINIPSKKALSGIDQALSKEGLYHTTYATSDDYRFYFLFNPNDLYLLPPAMVPEFKKTIPELETAIITPSYGGKQVFIVSNKDNYQFLRELFDEQGMIKRPAKTRSKLYQIGIVSTPITEQPVLEKARAELGAFKESIMQQ